LHIILLRDYLKKMRKSEFSNKIIIRILITAFIITGSLFFSHKINAASLSISPSSSTVSLNNIVTVKVLVDTGGKYINNAEATLQFPTDLLEVVSINKNSSVFSLWVEDPNFSNYTGKITFNGGVATPGYNGNSGSIASITFKAKKQGIASIIFTDGAVRENDGLGTDILISKNGGNIQIGAIKPVEIPQTTDDKNAVPSKPIITSLTHPDQNLWYTDNTASFSWKIPSGVTSLKTLFNKVPNSEPTISYDNSITGKTLNNISDGTYYFHLRFYNLVGGSVIAHYKVNIDSIPPVLSNLSDRIDNNHNILRIHGEDATSGIDYYNLSIDNGLIIKVRENELTNDEYILPVLSEGTHTVDIVVFDKAGNKTESTIIVSSPAIEVPTISLNTKEIESGDSIIISGKTNYSEGQIVVVVESDGKEIKRYTQKVLTDGTFSITTDKIRQTGLVAIWAKEVFSETVESGQSEKLYLKVNETEAVRITLSIFYPLLGIIVIIAIVIIIFIMLYLGWHKYFGLRKKIKEESKETAIEIHKAMLLLKDELNDQLEALERIKIERGLNDKEEAVFNEIKDNVNKIEQFIAKKLKDLI